jgi:hypothetical protein
MKTESGDDLIASNEQIIASVAVSRGRVYLVTTKAIYCIGKKTPSPELPAVKETVENAPSGAAVAHVQVVPAEILAKPGTAVKFRVRLYDDHGRFIREESNATWSLEGLKGAAQGNQFTAATDGGSQAGLVKATVGGVAGAARVRVIPALPLSEDFTGTAVDSVPNNWINATGKWSVREVDGNKLLVKNPNPPAFKRTRSFIGPADLVNYTVQADVRAVEKRRQMGDAGVVAQRYTLALFGATQRIELQSWQIEEKRTVRKPFAWKADTWYRMKLQVENLPDGKVRARGKAWLASDPEPAEWIVERIDPIGNRQGSPGIFADAPNDVFIDNIKVTPNK